MQHVIAYPVHAGKKDGVDLGTDVFFGGWYNWDGYGSQNGKEEEGSWYYHWWTPRPVSEWWQTQVWTPVSWIWREGRTTAHWRYVKGVRPHIGKLGSALREEGVAMPLMSKGEGRRPPPNKRQLEDHEEEPPTSRRRSEGKGTERIAPIAPIERTVAVTRRAPSCARPIGATVRGWDGERAT